MVDFFKLFENPQRYQDGSDPYQQPPPQDPSQKILTDNPQATTQCFVELVSKGQLPLTVPQWTSCVLSKQFNLSLFGSFGVEENRFSAPMRMYGGESSELVSGQTILNLTEGHQPIGLEEFNREKYGTLREFFPVKDWLEMHPQWSEQDLIDFNLALGAGANENGVTLYFPSEKATEVLSPNLNGTTSNLEDFLKAGETLINPMHELQMSEAFSNILKSAQYPRGDVRNAYIIKMEQVSKLLIESELKDPALRKKFAHLREVQTRLLQLDMATR
jgi:hypothetical protein